MGLAGVKQLSFAVSLLHSQKFFYFCILLFQESSDRKKCNHLRLYRKIVFVSVPATFTELKQGLIAVTIHQQQTVT
jgi:hypothetical protein